MRDKLIILLVALLVMSGDLYAQKLIKGEVVVKNTIQPLENALVMVLNKKIR
ncbi:hypothetical protein KUH03_11035 [Sphingobacterium sp. E70]|uniref:hypothetical protein n=1 Tax=Sphingobacterium sp. E70 TaxID=2853439 RepID=UPI00211B8A28|nr:hypothetical protein [Sphingobacterium sp. E70]ULT27234.1 hypothetical protein KUH03_11035 [Sphingobacterium sp. E70]